MKKSPPDISPESVPKSTLFSRLVSALRRSFATTKTVRPAVAIKSDQASRAPLPAKSTLQSTRINTGLRDRFYQLLINATSVEIAANEQELLAELNRELIAVRRQLPDLPRLPAIMPRIMATLRDSDASRQELVNIIREDPAIAASVLRLSNSSLYNSQRKITSIEQAVTQLGITGLRQLVSAAVMQPIVQVHSPLYAKFGKLLWEHSLLCAGYAEDLAAYQQEDRFKAYLLGLLHDVGAKVIFTHIEKLYRTGKLTSEPSTGILFALLHTHALQLSADIARFWDLPDDLVFALEDQAHEDAPPDMLGIILSCANELSELDLLRQLKMMNDEDVATQLQTLQLPADFVPRLVA